MLSKAGQAIAFDFEGIAIDQPVDITLGYDAGQDTSKLSIFSYDEAAGKWVYVPSEVVEGGIRASVNEFPATYAVLADTTAPDGAAAALSSKSERSITLSLSAHDDAGIAHYLIYRDGELIGQSEEETYPDAGLSSSHTYVYQVKAVDPLGNTSDFSEELSVKTESDDDSSPPSGGGGGGGIPSEPDETDTTDGETVEAVTTATTTEENGQTVLTATVDAAKLAEQLDNAGDEPVVAIPVTENTDKVSVVLTAEAIQAMENKEAVLDIQTPIGGYKLPASEVKVDLLAALLGGQGSESEVSVHVDIAKSDDAKVGLLWDAADRGSFTVVVPPIDFTVTATLGDKSVTVDTFSSYVEREIPIPAGVDAGMITAAVVLNEDGTTRSVPMKIVTRDGVSYAVINSLTNSTYALVSYPVAFSDVEQHWAKDAVNNMGSRMAISGFSDGQFQPDQAITRAEFATIMVRGLGLKPEEGASSFSDVKTNAWYSSAVNTAAAYGLINGFKDDTFRPNDKITREQAMVMIAKAMEIAKLQGASSEQSAAILQSFTDASDVSNWAESGVADSVQAGIVSGRGSDTLAPQELMTRAEVAAIIERLLESAELI